MLKLFAQLYSPKWLLKRGPVRSVEEFAESVGLGAAVTGITGEEWALKIVGVGEKWLGEVMEGSTRVNVGLASFLCYGLCDRGADWQYASDMTAIHGLGASVSMATSGARSIEGGNWQVFDAMLTNATAIRHMVTTVSTIPLSSLAASGGTRR